ncbi:MAG: ABC transporter ATP-binding protein, partial [Gammaproteobacteria bacterium]|nr:ABC transporter ATP-binding protein [Gammaproteobacteria bacterium]
MTEGALHLDLTGLGRIYLATWPYLFAQIGHFLALLGLNLLLLGFGTAVGFLGIDVLMDSVGRAEPLSAMQAAVMLLPEAGYVGVEALSEAARLEVLFRFLIVSAVILVTTTSAFTLLAMYKVWILQRVNQSLRVTMVRNAEDLSLRFHARMPAGDGIYRVFQDSAMVTAVIDHVVVQPVISIAMMALQIAVATLFSPYFAVLMLLASVVVLALALVVTPRLRTWSQAARRANAELFTRVQETFQGIQAIKAYGFEDANLARFRDESTKALDTAFALRRDFAALKVVVSYLLALLLFATDYLATRFVLAEGAVFGASLLVLFGMSVTQWTVAVHQARRSRIGAFALHFEELVRVWCYAQDMAVGLGRAFWLLAQQPEVSDPAEPVPFPAVREGVRFHGVGFGYAADTPVLRGFNFAARPGEVTALVGASGTGKSTAMALLLRLFDPDEGSVAIDGVDLRSVLRADLREHVAIALQENVLFPTSIADNLR